MKNDGVALNNMSILKEIKKQKKERRLSDEDAIDLIFAYLNREANGNDITNVLVARGYKLNSKANLTILCARLMTLLRQGKLKLVRK